VPVSSVKVTKSAGTAEPSSEPDGAAGECWGAAAMAEDPAASSANGTLSATAIRVVVLISILVAVVGRRLERRCRSLLRGSLLFSRLGLG
jgi:hypothetical protein